MTQFHKSGKLGRSSSHSENFLTQYRNRFCNSNACFLRSRDAETRMANANSFNVSTTLHWVSYLPEGFSKFSSHKKTLESLLRRQNAIAHLRECLPTADGKSIAIARSVVITTADANLPQGLCLSFLWLFTYLPLYAVYPDWS